MVPEGWKATEIDGLATLKSGGTPRKQDPTFWGGLYPWVSAKDLKTHFIGESIDTLTDAGFSAAKVAPQGAVLVLVRGMTLLKKFPVGIATRDVAFNQDLKALIAKSGVDSLFLMYLLVSNENGIRQLVNTAGHGTGRLDTTQFKAYPVNLPPFSEQTKIAQILSTWDKAIETTKNLIENSKAQKKALMQQLLTGKKRFPGFYGVWEKFTIEELEYQGFIALSRGNVISKKDIESLPGSYQIYSSSVKNNGLFGCYGEYMFDEELITWSVDGGGDFFYRAPHKFSVTNVSGYMRLDTNRLNYKFVAAQLQHLHSKMQFDYQTKAHPSVIRKLYTLFVPEVEEQQKIASILTTAEKEIETLQQKQDCLKQEKKALMQQLLTGKRRVKLDKN